MLRRSRSTTLFDRCVSFANPLLAWFLAVHVLRSILMRPQDEWNDIRLARSFALVYGFKIYNGCHELGPVFGTIHPPISHIAYLWVALIRQPTLALVTGSAFSYALILGVLLWFHLQACSARSAEQRQMQVFAFLSCGLAVIHTEGIAEAVGSIHADAISIFFATLAVGTALQAHPTGRGRWLGSALCAVLAVWSKQTMLPIVFPLLVFAWFRGGFAALSRYFLYLVLSGLGVSLGVIALFWPPQRLLFNILTLSSHKPFPAHVERYVYQGIQAARQDYQVFLIGAAAITIYLIFFNQSRNTGSTAGSISPAPVLCFAVFCSLFPGSLAAEITINGAKNDMGACAFFLVLSLTACLSSQAYHKSGLRIISQIVVTIVLLWNLHPLAIRKTPQAYRNLYSNPTQIAYSYMRLHPGTAYFPYNPLATLLAEGKVYHMDEQLYDREVAGYPVNEVQVRSGVPFNYEVLAVPPGEELQSSYLLKVSAGFTKVSEPGFGGWTFYRKM